MSTDTKPRFEDRLLEALLERHPARTGAPVARPQARPRRQRRGWQLGLAGATGLAVAAAGLAAAGVFTPRAASDLPDAQTVVYLASQALDQVRPGDVEFSTQTISVQGEGTVRVSMSWQRITGQGDKTVRAWRSESFQRSPVPPGQPLTPTQDSSWVYRGKTAPGHVVDYAKREWWPEDNPYPYASPPSVSHTQNGIKRILHNGKFNVVGKVWLHGQQTIEIARSGPWDERIWFNARTYLIVQYDYTGPARPGRQMYVSAQVRWLPPTRANLAKLVAPIPAGFHRLPHAPRAHIPVRAPQIQ